MSELVPYEGGVNPLRKSVQRNLRDIDEQVAVRRAELRASAQIAKELIDAEEAATAYRVDRRVKHAKDIASEIIEYNNDLDHQIVQSSKDNPGREMQNRSTQETFVLGANRLLYGYMAR